jgi:fatty acid desaturase/predicted heme/steroid binding protein
MGKGAGKGGGKGGEAMVAPNQLSGLKVGKRKEKLRKISLSELSQHREPENAWISYRGKVYDVSNWYDHPGGSVIFTHAGDDATDIFAAFHPPSSLRTLENFLIGELDENEVPEDLYANKFDYDKQKKFEKGYRELRAKILAAGLFNANPWYYVWKVSSNVGLLVAATLCCVLSADMRVNFLGAVIMALFWQQCGWLAHDFLHHQVFKNRNYGDYMGLLIGNVFQGFSVTWWKSKHNAHHAVPNLHASSADAHDGDPDIDTMPLLAWTKRMADHGKSNPMAKHLIGWQAFTYFPILGLARMSWLRESFKFVFTKPDYAVLQEDQRRIRNLAGEKICLVLHYVGLGAIMYNMPGGPLNAAMFFFCSQTICGLFLALVFGLGHNGMAVYPADQRPDFWKLQVTTTRNVTSNWFVDWFCGGLQYQVDHHLFPMLPRHNLATVHKLVESFCKEYGVGYHEATMFQGTKEVLNHLGSVASEFLEDFPAM